MLKISSRRQLNVHELCFAGMTIIWLTGMCSSETPSGMGVPEDPPSSMYLILKFRLVISSVDEIPFFSPAPVYVHHEVQTGSIYIASPEDLISQSLTDHNSQASDRPSPGAVEACCEVIHVIVHQVAPGERSKGMVKRTIYECSTWCGSMNERSRIKRFVIVCWCWFRHSVTTCDVGSAGKIFPPDWG